MNITLVLLQAHSGLRWFIVVAAIAALILFGNGWLTKKYYPKPARILSAMYSGLLDAQVLLGAIFIIYMGVKGGGFPRYRIEHMIMMIVAAVVAHLPRKWRDAAADVYHRNTFLTIVASLLLIYVGVALLPGGWSR